MSGSPEPRRPKIFDAIVIRQTKSLSIHRDTVGWQEVAPWQRDNNYILSGFRPAKPDYISVLKSLTFLHNETCNIYSHLIGAILLPLLAWSVLRHLSDPHFKDVAWIDYLVLSIFYVCAEICLVCSTAYHLLGCHSHEVEQRWLRMDLLGIIIVTVGTFVPGIYYLFACEAVLQAIHWSIISSDPPI